MDATARKEVAEFVSAKEVVKHLSSQRSRKKKNSRPFYERN